MGIQKNQFMVSSLAVLMAVAVSGCGNQSAKATPNFIYKDAPKAGVVAKIGDQEITEEELIGEEKLAFMDIKKREYEFKMNRLNDLLVERLVGAEAKKANMSTEDYIAKNVTKGEIKISTEEYNKFVKERKIPESQINAQLKDRINNYLKDQKKDDLVQAYIAKLTKSSPVEVYFSKPRMNIQVEVGNAPTWGKEDAKVTIVEISDFECPFCSKAVDSVNEIKKAYKGKVRIAFKHLPLPMHPNAKAAAEASMCVNEQSNDKFWKFHDTLFANQKNLKKEDLIKHAKTAGADEAKFKECLESGKYADHVKADMEYAEKLGVRSTPTFFINGQLVAGALPFEQFKEIIDEELEAVK